MTSPGARRALFVVTILTGSFLLFLVQPMVARMALPRLGGAPAVWNSAMLVYQALLLGGYAYAHWLGRLRPRAQAGVHLGVLLVACLWLPIGLMAMQLPADAEPAVWVPWLLAASIGPLFFAVSAQAPLIQRWFGVASGGEDPYALYAASNLGSFAGLIAYPLLVEPELAVRGQRLLWSGGYGLLILLVAACALLLPKRGEAEHAAVTSPAPDGHTVLRWVLLALVPSGLMLATSTFITTDIVAMPLLWVLPLGLYLLSFSVAFAANREYADLLTRIAPVTILLFGGVMISGNQERPYLNAAMALLLLFMASVALHTALYRARPAADRLTGFYLAMSAGGALGGVFAGLIAPVLFDWTYEYPILILAAGALAPQTFLTHRVGQLWAGRSQHARILTLALGLAMIPLILFHIHMDGGEAVPTWVQGLSFLVLAVAGVVAIGERRAFVVVLAGALIAFGGYRALSLSASGARWRSYFGVYTVRGEPGVRQLIHGTTVHGIELLGSPARERTPTSYYVPGSGVGQGMLAAPSLFGAQARIGVVGLGAGTLACYAQPGQNWRFFEIDPVVADIARDPQRFHFLSDCLPGGQIVIGDARLRLAEMSNASLDLLALDAFSSDSVPMHLLTAEAFALYGRVVQPKGVLLVHISNRFLNLTPVVSAAAARGGWQAMMLNYRPAGAAPERGTPSTWVALSRDPAAIAALKARDPHWFAMPRYPKFAGWTDDYSTILPLLKGY